MNRKPNQLTEAQFLRDVAEALIRANAADLIALYAQGRAAA